MELENETRTELDLALGVIGSERQGSSAGSDCGWRDESVRMRCASIACANDIIHAGVVGAVCQVKRFGHELNAVMIAETNASAKPQIEGEVIRAETSVTADADGPVVGGMMIAIDVGTGEKIERMSTVVSEDGRKFEIRQIPGLPRTVEDARDDDLMTLIEFG